MSEYNLLAPIQIKGYHEAKTKQGFIQPLFRSLGWDFDDVDEVSPEENASKGRVDYAFKLKGVSRFYLEAKSLKADLNSPEYIKQAVTYAYNKGVTWAGLTSFDRLKVFNAQTGQPFINLSYQDFIEDFDRLWLLSKESIQLGNLDKEAAKVGALLSPQPIEKRLFNQLSKWREELSSQLEQYNKDTNDTQRDSIIQRIFNRLIFIRTCEDRGIEERTLLAAVNQWKSHGHKPELIETLKAIFIEFDQHYDSDLFAPHNADNVFVEANTLYQIIEGLYEIPGGIATYDFSVIDADVLGAVYEQYLGHVANIVRRRVTKKRGQLSLGLTIQEYPLETNKEKRKEQGIYYTPKWITEYIVKHTVGQFISEHNHDEILKIKVLDPACGSGSFLIRAYDELLHYHASANGKPLLELDQWDRLPILKGNIFGVDLDNQATEIAKLNLLLRTLARREILPSLADNIRQGNSLISGGEKELDKYFGNSWKEKHPFDWSQEFTAMVPNGEFDIVIGNPPYIKIQTLQRDEADYYRDHFVSASGSFDIYVLFLERGIQLLKPGGRLGFICSSKFLKSQYGTGILKLIQKYCVVESIIDLSAQTVFAEATTYPAIIIIKKELDNKSLQYVSVPQDITDSKVTSALVLEELPIIVTAQDNISKKMWPPLAKGDNLWDKLITNTVPLGEISARIFQGLITSADKVYILEKLSDIEGGLVRVKSKSTNAVYDLEAELLKPFLTGKNINRYFSPVPNELLLFPYHVCVGTASLISENEFVKKYPKSWEYLNLCVNRTILEAREDGKLKGPDWYKFGRTQNLGIHTQPKLAIPSTVKRLSACYDAAGAMYLDNVRVNGILLTEKSDINYKYILGLFNSSLLHWFFARLATPFANGWFGANRQFIEPLPIRIIDISNPDDQQMQNNLVILVEQMLVLQKHLQEIPPEFIDERHDLERQIQRLDIAVDNQVFDLYGLNEAERKAVST